MKNPYEILGLTSDASEEELRARYEQLVAKYKDERFLPGEAGNQAAEKLNDVEDAWREIMRDIEARKYSNDYDRIAALIKQKKLQCRAGRSGRNCRQRSAVAFLSVTGLLLPRMAYRMPQASHHGHRP